MVDTSTQPRKTSKFVPTMLRSKSSRSPFPDFGNKSNESVLSRTLSSSKFCRGDDLGKSVNWNAHKSSEKRRSLDKTPSKVAHITESQIQKALSMQEHKGQLEEELKWAKERIFIVEEERKRAVDDMRDAKRVAYEANMKVDESLSPKRVGEYMTEIRTLKEELRMKDKNMEAMKKDVENAKQLELKLTESEALLKSLKEEINKTKAFDAVAMDELSACKKRIEQLQDELQRRKEYEVKMLNSAQCQTEQLQQAKFEVVESKLKTVSLNDKIVSLESSLKQNDEDYVPGVNHNLSLAKVDDMISSLKSETLLGEMESLRNELRLALDAEEKSKKAMDDLALALKEVATESNQAKEKGRVTELELEYVKAEAEQLKQMIRSTEERYEKLLDDAKNEAELHRNTSDRLRLEAEETLLTWNGKEMGFVNCIKRAEEERAVAQHEKSKMNESLKSVEHTARVARDECSKLRDILKQAINESNAAKAAASIARDENSQLKDCLVEKDEALHFLAQENERLRISETAAYENIKAFKRVLSQASANFKSQEEEDEMLKSSEQMDSSGKHVTDLRKTFGFDFEVFQLPNDSEDSDQTNEHNDPQKAEALKGSIFDSDASEPQTPNQSAQHRRETSSIFTDDGETTNSDDPDHLENSHFDESETDRNHRRRKTMFQRVGSLIMRRSFQRKEPSLNGIP